MNQFYSKFSEILYRIFETSFLNPFYANMWLLNQLYQMCTYNTNFENLFIFSLLFVFEVLTSSLDGFAGIITRTTFIVILYKTFTEDDK